ncbi:MAG: KpsF/GutQ family sugar-phosphate isomerase [Pseudomonadota bacterium]
MKLKIASSAPDAVTSALRTLECETEALDALYAALQDGMSAPFRETVEEIFNSSGRVIVAGMGKSGHVAKKLAATLASTGTPAYFVHPAEAGHGDLGMIRSEDVVLALSWSGETAELRALIDYAKRFGVLLVALTSEKTSTLAQAADIAITLPRVQEACPNGLAPTSSTLMQMALGDCLAVALLERRGFSAQDFRVFHPGGKLGAGLKHLRDVMHKDKELPLVKKGTKLQEAILIMTEGRKGCAIVIDMDGRLAGIITDGDLRRAFEKGRYDTSVDDIMTQKPRTLTPEAITTEALNIMNTASITVLPVVDGAGTPVGLVHLHDLLSLGVV